MILVKVAAKAKERDDIVGGVTHAICILQLKIRSFYSLGGFGGKDYSLKPERMFSRM